MLRFLSKNNISLFWVDLYLTRFRINIINIFSREKQLLDYQKERFGDNFLYYKKPLTGLLKGYKLNNRKKIYGENDKGFTEKICIESFHIYNISTCLNSNNESELLSKAIRIYKEFAENGVPEAYNNLGILFCYEGENSNYKRYFELAAESGSSEAMLNLAYAFYSDKIETYDREKYFYWLNKAADIGNPIALFNIGVSYHFGLELEKNISLAVDYYKKAINATYKIKDSDKIVKIIKKRAIINLICIKRLYKTLNF